MKRTRSRSAFTLFDVGVLTTVALIVVFTCYGVMSLALWLFQLSVR